jgi:D-alanyl-D-alanine carboxypeptidase
LQDPPADELADGEASPKAEAGYLACGPLDLTHTSFPTAAAPPHLPVQGYTVEGKDALPTSVFESPAELSWSGAAGAMNSTVADLQVWARAPATGALLSPSMQRQRLQLVPLPLLPH